MLDAAPKDLPPDVKARSGGAEARSLSPICDNSGVRGGQPLDLYALGKPLGKGAFGKVNVAVHKLTEELTAVKLCDRRRLSEAQARRCLNQEVAILRRLNGHPNVIQLFEVFETHQHVVLVMELATGGDLLRYVRQRRCLSEPCSQDLFRQLMDGIRYIHGMLVVHRDIKLENLLLDCHGCLKIADFGVAAVVKDLSRKLTDHCGTPSYLAPEVLLEFGYEGPPVDVWGAGVVLYAMLCGRVPFKGEHFSDLRRSILAGQFSTPSQLSEGAASILRAIIVVDPKVRATVSETLSHPWLAGIGNRAEELDGGVPRIPRASLAGLAAEEGDGGCGGGGGVPVLSRRVLAKVVKLGFAEAHVEESVRDGKLNHAAATYHLIARQRARRAGTSGAAIGPHGASEADRHMFRSCPQEQAN